MKHALILCIVVPLASAAVGDVTPEPPIRIVEDIEDVRLLFCLASYRIHELETLITYARDFNAPGYDPAEAREWHLRALRVFEPLKSLDDAGQSLVALVDFKQHNADIREQLGLMRAMLGESARQVLALYRDLDARIAAVRAEVDAHAAASGLRPPEFREPIPWPNPGREIGRRMGHTLAWFYRMFPRVDGPHAALDRQQHLDTDYLLGKAQKLGIRAVVPEFPRQDGEESCSWRVCEPEEGRYDFSRIDAAIAAAARHGLKTIVPVRSLTTEPPDWALAKFGDDCRLQRYDEKQKAIVPTTGVNLFHPPTRDAFLRYVAALARHLRENHPDQVSAFIAGVRTTSLPADVDYSPAAQEHFRTWLKGRCGKIARLNELWGTNYQSFDAVSIPLPRAEAPRLAWAEGREGEPLAEGAKWHHWIAWRKAWVAEYYRMQADVLRREMPGVPIQAYALQADSHHAHTERPVASWPLQAMGDLADLPSSCATVEPVHVLLRSVGGGKFAGGQAEQNFGSMLAGCAYASFLKDVLLSVARDGPEMIFRYFYADGLYTYMDRQFGWDGAYSYRLKVRDMGRLATLIENTEPSPTSIAVLWSENSYDQDPTMYSRWGVLGTCYALMCAKVHYDIVLESQVAANALDRYRFLIVPEQRYLTDTTLQRIREFVRRGGRLFATGVPGMFDEMGRYRGHPLADVFGADLKSFIPIQAVPGTYLVPTHPNSIWGNRERGCDGYRRRFYPHEWDLHLELCASFLPRAGAQVMHEYPDGSAAMVRQAFGAGMAVIFGYPFGHEYAFSNPTEMSFGKIYPHFPYPPQMTALETWLGKFVRNQLQYPQRAEVPKSWTDRFVGRNRSAPSLTYPGFGDTYETKRLETDMPNHSLALGWRRREGLRTEYLTVFNRDSAYAVNRGYIHFMASPTHAIIRINRTDVAAVYDVINRSYVPLVKGDLSTRDRRGNVRDADKCVSFETIIPPYFGRVFAISTQPGAELFTEEDRGGITDAELESRTARLAAPWQPPAVTILDRDGLRQWLADKAGAAPAEPLVISYGSEDYRRAAEKLAELLEARGVRARISSLGIRHETHNPDAYYRFRSARYRRPLKRIDAFVGNDYSNSNLADLTGGWQCTRYANPRLPVSINREFPGGDRCVVMLTHPFFVSRGRGSSFPDTYHRFAQRPRQLVIGASSPAGAMRGVAAFAQLQRQDQR